MAEIVPDFYLRNIATLLRPKHMHQGVSTPQEYRQRQREWLDEYRRKFPNLDVPKPHVSRARVTLMVVGGMIRVACVTKGCASPPMADPDWKLACCYSCGAIYTDLVVPRHFDQIEAVLLKRPSMAHRNWTTEPLAVLKEENRLNGDPV